MFKFEKGLKKKRKQNLPTLPFPVSSPAQLSLPSPRPGQPNQAAGLLFRPARLACVRPTSHLLLFPLTDRWGPPVGSSPSSSRPPPHPCLACNHRRRPFCCAPRPHAFNTCHQGAIKPRCLFLLQFLRQLLLPLLDSHQNRRPPWPSMASPPLATAPFPSP
jgi:hypothetical protein